MGTPTAAIVLAAGEGKRMKSGLPKVLHPVGGLPMVAHVVGTALSRKCDPVVVVVNSEGRRIRDFLSGRFPEANLKFAVQKKQRGTGDAARVGLRALGDRPPGRCLILYGDVPLLSGPTLGRLQRAAQKAPVSFLTALVADPSGYGRVLRNGSKVLRVVEDRDADAEQKRINEINAGVYVTQTRLLRRVLEELKPTNAQGELYLTDLIEGAQGKARAVCTDDLEEIQGVNDPFQLAEAEVFFRRRRILDCMGKGVHFQDPNTVVLGADVKIEAGASIGVGVQLYGATRIGRGARVEGPTIIRDSTLGAEASVLAFSHLEGARVRSRARIGPYARLRPEADVGEDARVGNFVEVKKSTLGRGAKANHLAYLGDSDIGPGSNVGAGTITCNYDGAGKHRTQLGKNVFVGSNSTLVAPLTLGDGVYVAAGSTVTRDVEKDALAFGRARQEDRPGLARRLRQRLKRSPATPTTGKKTRPGGSGKRD